MHPAIAQQLARLGGTIPVLHSSADFLAGKAWYVLKTGVSWSPGTDPDPQGQFSGELPLPLRELESVQWPTPRRTLHAYFDQDDEEPVVLDLTNVAEDADVEIDGQRRLLYTFCLDRETQFFYCLDALEEAADPPVFGIDHDGTDPYLHSPTLSEFLACLQLPSPQEAPTETENPPS